MSALIEQDAEYRQKMSGDAIREVLQMYNCTLLFEVVYGPNGIENIRTITRALARK